jgi:Uncharacterized membrane protein required for alginate biosynthesis
MDLILKATLGAAVVVILAALAKTKNYYIAGLVPLELFERGLPMLLNVMSKRDMTSRAAHWS